MAKIVSRLDLQKGVVAEPIDFFQDFFVKRGLEGKQIVIGLGKIPFSFTRIVLVRKRGSFPENLTDGVVLLDEQPPSSISYIDLDIDDLTVYYYQLFYFDESGNPVQDNRLRGKDFSCEVNFFCNKLYSLLPPDYRLKDLLSNQVRLSPIADPNAFNEIRRLNADPNQDLGELQRFLCIFGVMLDEALCLIRFMPKLWDIDETCSDFLPLIAELVGIEFNFELTIPRQREEIRQAIANFKRRGTLSGIETFINRVSGKDPEIEFGKNFVWKFNDPSSGFIDFATVDHSKNYVTKQDETRYFLDISEEGFAGFEKIIIHLGVDTPDCSYPKQTIKKIKRLITEQIPFDSRALFIMNDVTPIDEGTSFNSNEVVDTDILDIFAIINSVLSSPNLIITPISGGDFVFLFNDLDNAILVDAEDPNHQNNFFTPGDINSYFANINGGGFSGEDNNAVFISGDNNFSVTQPEIQELAELLVPSGFIIVIEEKVQNIDVSGGANVFEVVETTLTP